MKQTITVTGEAEIPEGYEVTGEYRVPKVGESFIDSAGGALLRTQQNWTQCRIILRKVPMYRPARKEDAIRALQGITVAARFRDSSIAEWNTGNLSGMCMASEFPWGGPNKKNFRYCEVLDV